MNLDFSYQLPPAPNQVEEAVHKHFRLETWALEGSEGDQVLVDAYLPERIDRIVIMGHGADNSRKARYIEVSGKSFVRHRTGVIGMDAPFHGDRCEAKPLENPVGSVVDVLVRWVRDHRRLLDVIESRWPGVPCGFAGFSMGGLYGVPLVAADSRIHSAAIVIAGSTRVSYPIRFGPLDESIRNALEFTDPTTHAGQVGDRPVLMINAEEDEIVPSKAAIALYEALSGAKELVFMPGTHTEWGDAARWFRRLEAFFRATLR